MIHDNVLVWGNGNPDANLEARAVMMFVAWRDHRDAATDDTVIVQFQSLCFSFDFGAYSSRRLASFEGHLQRGLHDGLSVFVALPAGKRGTARKVATGDRFVDVFGPQSCLTGARAVACLIQIIGSFALVRPYPLIHSVED